MTKKTNYKDNDDKDYKTLIIISIVALAFVFICTYSQIDKFNFIETLTLQNIVSNSNTTITTLSANTTNVYKSNGNYIKNIDIVTFNANYTEVTTQDNIFGDVKKCITTVGNVTNITIC